MELQTYFPRVSSGMKNKPLTFYNKEKGNKIKQEKKIIHNENHTMMKFRDWPGLSRKKGASAAVFVFHILCKNKNFFECVGDGNHTSFPNLAYCNCPFSL
jgi:hypothetical protein